MSYLPRMSKTYREPEQRIEEGSTKEITFNSIRIASAQPDERTYNPQTVLKQYSYYPHPPPVLPGPSLIKEAEENEKISMEAKGKRSKEENLSRMSISKTGMDEEFPIDPNDHKPVVNFAFVDVKPAEVEHEECAANNSMKTAKLNKTKKGSFKINKSREEAVKAAKFAVNDETLTKKETKLKSPLNLRKQDAFHRKEVTSVTSKHSVWHGSSHIKDAQSDPKRHDETGVHVREGGLLSAITDLKGSVHEGVQCSPMSTSEKILVMPSCIHYLMKTLSFLVQELDKSEVDGKSGATKELKKLLRQINETITALSSRKIDGTFSLQTSLSDRKRLEKIYSDLEQYIGDVYGQNGKLGCKSEERKRLYCKLFQKEFELNVLNEKLRQSEIQNPSLKQMEPMTKPPEVLLQNKNLENEQLRAEVEFNAQELTKFHQTLAEKHWEIYKCKEEISSLKKKLTALKSKSKT